MAYSVSQLRKQDGQGTYMTNLPSTATTITSPNTFGRSEPFSDFALASTFSAGEVYYLRFKVHKIPQYFYSGSIDSTQVNSYVDSDELRLQILLKNDGEDDESTYPPEIIGSCSVPKGVLIEKIQENSTYYTCDEYSSYSFVFSPSKTFNRLGFRVNRVSYDAINSPRKWLTEQGKVRNSDEKITNSDGTITISGRRFDEVAGNQKIIKTTGPRILYSGEHGDLCRLIDLVSTSKSKTGWLKFGYQCRPGSLIVVNKEPIRLGRSGIYEINNGTTITSFMIASPRGSENKYIDAFLLDYAYNTN